MAELNHFETAYQVGFIADQMISYLKDKKTRSNYTKMKLDYFYDFSDKIEHGFDRDLRIGVLFTVKKGLRFGVAQADDDNLFSHVIFIPNLLSCFLNYTVMKTQTGLHHEIAHILLHDCKIDFTEKMNYIGSVSV